MLIFGAKGLAKEVLEVCLESFERKEIVFYDDISSDLPVKLYNEFKILRSKEEAGKYFKDIDARFILGIGGPELRGMVYRNFEELGGQAFTLISNTSRVGSFGVQMGKGVNVMLNSVITNDVIIGDGVLVNQMVSIGHDVNISDFVEVCPGVAVSGHCKIGSYSFLGTNCTILPNISIGHHVVVGAGSVINKNIPDGCTVVGVPGKIIKTMNDN